MPRLMRTVGRTAVIAGTATAVSGRVGRRQQDKWADQEQAQYDQQQAQAAAAPPPPPAQAAPPAAPAASGEDRLAQLQQLGELKAQGILTDAEFEAEKAKILAQ